MFKPLKKEKTYLLATVIFLAVFLLLFFFSNFTNAAVHVNGYYKSNGTYVQPYYRSNPDGNFYNNWSTKGNVNPYTGKVGTKTQPSYTSEYSTTTNYLKPLPTLSNINKEINNVKLKYRLNHDGFRERLITQVANYLGADKNEVATQVYSSLPDITN
jgi:hypothetical protein